MAKPRITFTSLDGVSRTLQSDYPDPACRLKSWHPAPEPIGDVAHDLAKELRHMFRTSRRFGCHFEMHGLRMGGFTANHTYATPLSIAAELKEALLNGSTCALFTEDAQGNSYATCSLMPGTVPEIFLVNRRTMEYAIRLSLINAAASPVAMSCHYFTGYERVVYLMESGTANILEMGMGNELGEAVAWVKDTGSNNVFDLDDDRAEKDAEFAYLMDDDNNLVEA